MSLLVVHRQLLDGDKILMSRLGIAGQCLLKSRAEFIVGKRRVDTSFLEQDVQYADIFQTAVQALSVEGDHRVCRIAEDNTAILVVIGVRLSKESQ